MQILKINKVQAYRKTLGLKQKDIATFFRYKCVYV